MKKVGDFRRSFRLVVGKDFVEILLDGWMESENPAHARLQGRQMPAQNSDSVSGVTLPDSVSESRLAASSRTSARETDGVALRKSSLASFRRDR